MPRTALPSGEILFNIRVDANLKARFMSVTQAEARPASEVLRGLMREYVAQSEHRAFLAEAARQSRIVAQSADEADALLWAEHVASPLPVEPETGWFHLPGVDEPEKP